MKTFALSYAERPATYKALHFGKQASRARGGKPVAPSGRPQAAGHPCNGETRDPIARRRSRGGRRVGVRSGGDVTCCVGEREGLHGAAGSPLGGRQVLRELEGVDGVPGAALRRWHPAFLFLFVLGDFETPSGLGEALVGHVAVALLRAKPPRVVVLSAVLDEAAAVALHRQRGAPLRVAEMFRP